MANGNAATPAAQLAAQILARRKVLLWIGAGTSMSTGIPADSPDATGLAHRLALIHYGNQETVRQHLGERFRLPELCGAIGKARIRDLLLQLGWSDFAPGVAQRAIAALVVEGFNIEIVTINFDPLLEKALTAADADPTVIFTGANVPALTEESIFVIKVHGCPYQDPDAEHLLLMQAELEHPPGWVVHFLNGRLQQRVLVYSGFSGNAPYVWDSIREVREGLERQLNDAFAVDLDVASTVYAQGNTLGEFYQHCQVPEANYASGGADRFFDDVANLVFRGILTEAIQSSTPDARAHAVAANPDFLTATVVGMTYTAIRAFAGRLGRILFPKSLQVRSVELRRCFKWMMILVTRGIVEAASFRPVLAAPYKPGPTGTSAAPIVFFDGGGDEALICRQRISDEASKGNLRRDFQLLAVPRWFAVVLNCVGPIEPRRLDIIPREEDSALDGYDPVVFRDENSLLASIQDGTLEGQFR